MDDVQAECERLGGAGVDFTQEPLDIGPAVIAVFDDTCGTSSRSSRTSLKTPEPGSAVAT